MMTKSILSAWRAEAMHYIRAEVEATETQRALAWRFLLQDRKRQQETA